MISTSRPVSSQRLAPRRLLDHLAPIHEAGWEAPAALARVLRPPPEQDAALPGDHRQHRDLRVVPDHPAAGRADRVLACRRRTRRARISSGVAQRVQKRLPPTCGCPLVRWPHLRPRSARRHLTPPSLSVAGEQGGFRLAVGGSALRPPVSARVRLRRVDVRLLPAIRQVQPGDLRAILLEQRPPALVALLLPSAPRRRSDPRGPDCPAGRRSAAGRPSRAVSLVQIDQRVDDLPSRRTADRPAARRRRQPRADGPQAGPQRRAHALGKSGLWTSMTASPANSASTCVAGRAGHHDRLAGLRGDGRLGGAPDQALALERQELFRLAHPRGRAGRQDDRGDVHAGVGTRGGACRASVWTPFLAAIISARTESAISSGLRARMSRPIGAWIFASCSSVTPTRLQPLDPPGVRPPAADRPDVPNVVLDRLDDRRVVQLRIVGQHHDVGREVEPGRRPGTRRRTRRRSRRPSGTARGWPTGRAHPRP